MPWLRKYSEQGLSCAGPCHDMVWVRAAGSSWRRRSTTYIFTITEKASTRAFSWLKGDKVDNTWSKTLVTLMYFRNYISKADRGCVNRR